MAVIDLYSQSDNKYGIVYSDPPWQQQKGNIRACRPRQGRELDYSTMTLEEISRIHRLVSENLCDKKHNFFVWTIDKYLFDAQKMMENIGYTLHARMVWNKGNGIAPAFTVRFSHEYLLWFYKKGNMLLPCHRCRGKYTDVINESSTIHSKKPSKGYEMIEDMFEGAPKLELFARNRRAGWDCWGNEV